MEVSNKDKPLKGWLRRKGGRMNSWSRRWFVLNDHFLFMFLREEDRRSQECLTLDGQIIVEPSMDSGDPRQGYFDIIAETDKGPTEVLSLCAETEEEKKIWVRALKRALYAKKGGALFSQSLEEILAWERASGRPVHIPYIVNECVEYLYKYGLDVEGIFRLPGRQSSIKEIIARFERGQKIKFEEENTDVHVVASVLKTFLRDLPDSLVPCNMFQKFMNIALRFMEGGEEAAKNKCVEELSLAIKNIPKDNYVVLKYICRFLRDIGLHEPTNKMSMMSIGTVFGYNIIRHIDKENSQLFLCTADLGQNLVYMLLNYFPQVFMVEYSDRGSQANNVPTADLLRMSKVLDTPVALPLSPAFVDLEGISLTFVDAPEPAGQESFEPLTMSEEHFSEEVSKTCDSDDGIEDSIFVRSAEFAEAKRRNLKLNLAGHGGLGRSYSTPTSPNSLNGSNPPVPPRRTKSRINRNRYTSEKRRPDLISTDIDPKLLFLQSTSAGVNSDDVLTALAHMKVHTSDQLSSSCSSPTSTSSHNSIPVDHLVEHSYVPETDSDGTPSPISVRELHNQVSNLKEELSIQRERFKSQVTALKGQLHDIHEKYERVHETYERRLDTMSTEFKLQLKELENKLLAEKEACALAEAKADKLQHEVDFYQKLYGKSPTT